jgi:hypothetical protein
MSIFYFTLILGIVFGFLLHFWLLSYLKTTHPRIWEALGSPTYLFSNTIPNNVVMLSFIYTRKYLQLKDGKLNTLCDIIFAYGILYLAYFIIGASYVSSVR